MGSPYSVLQNITRADIRHDPYPHIVMENCLPADLYAALTQSYPSDDAILRLSGAGTREPIRQNSRHDLSAHRILRHPAPVSREWQAFVRHHVSNEFFREFAQLLGPEIRNTYPKLETRLGRNLEDCTTGIRFDPEWDTGQIALDCQIGINTPVTRRSSVRRVHTDDPEELFAMLLYFRRDDDFSQGGDLEIFRWKDDRPHLFAGIGVDETDAERVGVVPYKPNTLVAFINSDLSLHAVSPRDPSRQSRRLVNIVGRLYRSVPEGLFVKQQKTGFVPVARKALDRIHPRRTVNALYRITRRSR